MNRTLIAIIIIFTFISCGNQKKKKNVNEIDTDKLVIKEAISAEVKKQIKELPSSYELVDMLNKIGVDYILDIANPISNSGGYFSQKSRALNLGVYTADLCYTISYNRVDEIIDYVQTSKYLADNLSIEGAYDDQTVRAIESNLENKDEMIRVLSSSSDKIFDFLCDNGKDNILYLIIAGGWVESSYIICKMSEKSKISSELLEVLFKQKENFYKIYEIISKNGKDKDIQEIKNKFNSLKKFYDSINTSISREELDVLSKFVSDIRKIIIA